jgi:hypothetical protein
MLLPCTHRDSLKSGATRVSDIEDGGRVIEADERLTGMGWIAGLNAPHVPGGHMPDSRAGVVPRVVLSHGLHRFHFPFTATAKESLTNEMK